MNPTSADVRDLAERLTDATRHDDVDTLAALLASIVDRNAVLAEFYEPVLAKFVVDVARTLRYRFGDEDADNVFTVDLMDGQENPVAIDELDPALRAVLRAVLAQLNGDDDDARFQLSLVEADPEPLSRLDALWHVLLWSVVFED
ncbi:hypothetical protein [Saccharomonospora viridis]|uniref:hypothetical protein n=1 Tax=Saccharomonospora viridis TaxID=1852 RepID=UPI0023F405AF|nr:hypothetical protein [Saccharomonospora viridis]